MLPRETKEIFVEWIVQNPSIASGQYQYIDHSVSPVGVHLFFEYSPSNADPIVFKTDFIFTDFVNGKPDDFSKFAYSVALEDLYNYRYLNFYPHIGRMHKNYIRALCHVLHPLSGILVTPTSTAQKPRVAKNQPSKFWQYSFSISKGLRTKYTVESYSIDDKQLTLKPIPSSESVYNRNIDSIITTILGINPSEKDYSDFWSLYKLSYMVLNMFGNETEQSVWVEAKELTIKESNIENS
jgi:hypothetical protein